MREKEMVAKLENTIYLLYQNRAREAMEQVAEWLTVFQGLLGDGADTKHSELVRFGVVMVRELLEAYQTCDMMAMADCMAEKAVLFVQAYFPELCTEKGRH